MSDKALNKSYLLRQLKNFFSSIVKPALDEKVVVVDITKAEYEKLTDEEKNNASILWNTVDEKDYDPEDPENFEKANINFATEW